MSKTIEDSNSWAWFIAGIKAPRDDKDAAWLMRNMAVSSDGFHIAIRSHSSDRQFNRRIRAIARRLNGGKDVRP